MIRLFRLLACLSAFMLVMSGGVYAHAPKAHSHAVAIDHGEALADGQADGGDADTVDESQLHCGASILSLAYEYRVPLRPTALAVPATAQRAMSPAILSFEPPPPRTTS